MAKWNVVPSDEAAMIGERQLQKNSYELEMFLKAQSGCNPAIASDILQCTLKRKSMEEVREQFEPPDIQERRAISESIARGSEAFFRHHKTGGTRVKSQQDGMDAALLAACFDNGDVAAAPKDIAKVLGQTTDTIEKYQLEAKRMRETGDKFEPTKRQKRQDSIIDEAARAVHEFCHSEEGSKRRSTSFSLLTSLVHACLVEESQRRPVPFYIFGRKERFGYVRTRNRFRKGRQTNNIRRLTCSMSLS